MWRCRQMHLWAGNQPLRSSETTLGMIKAHEMRGSKLQSAGHMNDVYGSIHFWSGVTATKSLGCRIHTLARKLTPNQHTIKQGSMKLIQRLGGTPLSYLRLKNAASDRVFRLQKNKATDLQNRAVSRPPPPCLASISITQESRDEKTGVRKEHKLYRPLRSLRMRSTAFQS